jgi:tetratricopeptide (TPR) repeat protein
MLFFNLNRLTAMKRISHLTLILLTCQFFSCNEEFLDTVATDSYNEANWWQTESQAISSINGCYAALRDIVEITEENVSPNSYNMSGEIPLATGTHTPGNVSWFNNKWNENYGGIGRVNNFLDNIDRVPMDDALKQRMKGEAYFLRGLFYSKLVNYFGGVPLILESPDFVKHSDLPRNTRQEVVAQILTDLETAASILPESYSGSNIGRATKGAALALKSRVLLYEGRWSEAAQAAQAVIDLNQYSLFPDYRRLFLLENESNSEVIFDVQYQVPEYFNTFDILLDLQLTLAPTKDLIDSYLVIDGKTTAESLLYDPARPYENRDPRLHQTVVIPGYLYRGAIANPAKYFSTGYGFKKYTTYKDDVVHTGNISQSEINFILLRYADVLLMYAEAQNEAVGPDQSVYDALKEVRQRAGIPEVPAGLSQDEMRQVIRHERRIELAGEALYYDDIRRWRIAEIVMNDNVLNSKGEVLQVRSFNPERDYLWPIHEITLQENPALEQNPGY